MRHRRRGAAHAQYSGLHSAQFCRLADTVRLPSWEDGQAYAGERERHSRCDASVCLCPGGREQAEEGGPWELLLCSSCAAEGTHRHCSSLSSSTASWECDSCAGLGTASSATSELAGPSRAGAGPSRGSPAPGSSSPGTASQAAARLFRSSPALETGIQSASGSSRGSPAPGTSSPGTASQAASRPGHSSPARASGSCSSPPGPDRTRTRSRLQHRAQIPYSRPRRRHENRQMPAPSAGSSTQSQAGRGPSHGSPVPNTSSPSIASQLPSGSSCGSPALEGSSGSSTPGPTRVRALSRAQRRAPDPYSRPRRTRRTRSPAPAPSAESSTPSLPGLDPSHRSPAPETSSPSTASQLPSGSSCGSPALESGSRSSSPGPVRIRESSRVQRRAQNPYSRPRRRRGTSCAPSPSAGPDAPPPGQ
ncbi:uncharacterized protein LOC141749190 [Larus michahellis]|uniref:uncharacterized protein LOC141749190 n=1 Tax=Larus michahellis TaxID=119627 RepID=UPI003D9BA5B5